MQDGDSKNMQDGDPKGPVLDTRALKSFNKEA